MKTRKSRKQAPAPPINNVRNFRTEEGLTIANLATLSVLSQTTIWEIEHHKGNITDVTKAKLLKGFNKNPEKRRDYVLTDLFPEMFALKEGSQ